MHLARDAIDPQTVRAVGRDLQDQYVGCDRQHVLERRARLRAVRLQHQDPLVIGADRELVLGQDHAVRGDAAELGLAQLDAVREHSAGLGHSHGLAGLHVRSATYYGEFFGSVVDLAKI